MKYMYAILLLTFLTGCSLGWQADDSATDHREEQDRIELLQTYQSIEGKYSGTTTAGFDIELFINAVEVPSGSRQDGSAQTKPILRATLRRLDNLKEYLLEGSYRKAQGELVLSMPVSGSEYISFTGNVQGNSLIGRLVEARGIIGDVDLKLVDANPTVPSEGRDSEEFDRLRNQYLQIEGTYIGLVETDPKDRPSFKMMIRLTVVNEPTPTGTLKPVIRAFAKPLDVLNDELKMEYFLTALYQPQYSTPRISLNTGTQANAAKYLDLDGTIQNGLLTLVVKDMKGIVGTIKASKQ